MWEQVKRVLKPRGAFVTTASQPFTSKLVMSNLEWFKYEWIWEKSKGANFASCNYQPMRVCEEVVIFSSSASTYTKNGDCMIYNPQKQLLKKSYIRNFENNKRESPSAPLRISKIKEKTYTHKQPRNIIYAATDGDGRVHPTQKPVALYEYLILTYTNEGDTVMDITMGSGTTGVACVKTGRKFIGIELDEKYFKIAEKRIHDAQQQMRLPL